MKSLFLTFGDGSNEFRAAALRLADQAKELDIFTSIRVLNHETLWIASEEYRRSFSSIEKLDAHPKYFRAVKAWVIHTALIGKFGEFDVICYADAGCEILSNRITRLVLKRNIQSAYLYGGLAEQLTRPERNWTKQKTFAYFNTSSTDRLSGQIQSTLSYWRVDEGNIKLASQWCLASNNELDLWQDPKDKNLESSYFEDHRHDQSIFSLLWKQAELPVAPMNSQWTPCLPAILTASTPIQTIRNRTGDSKIRKISRYSVVAIASLLLNKVWRIKR